MEGVLPDDLVWMEIEDSSDNSSVDSSDSNHSESSNDSATENNNNIQINAQQLVNIVCSASIISALVLTDPSFGSIPLLPGRVGNEHRDRQHSLLTVRSWDDTMFKRQFRLTRLDFNMVLEKIYTSLYRNEQQAINSSGSAVSPELKLLITLRILAGASYLDMIWYNVCVDHVMDLVAETCLAIHNKINNIKMPSTEADFVRLSDGWQHRIKSKFGDIAAGIFQTVIAAGDGFVVEIDEPVREDLNGRPAKLYVNRKGYFGLVVQAFCDAVCRFVYFNVGWPGSTNDVTAYDQSSLRNKMRDGSFPEWVGFVLDEAYSSFGGTHFTPFTQNQLDRAYNEGGVEKRLYYQMRAYNHCLSSLRIHIERAFGLLVRRWGILWKSSELRLKRIILIVVVCAKLHNICLDRWILEHGEAAAYSFFDNDDILEHVDIPHMSPLPTDEEVTNRFRNAMNELIDRRSARAAASADMRVHDMQLIYQAGIRITANSQSLNGLPAIGAENGGQDEGDMA